jgi:hypothetical protein
MVVKTYSFQSNRSGPASSGFANRPSGLGCPKSFEIDLFRQIDETLMPLCPFVRYMRFSNITESDAGGIVGAFNSFRVINHYSKDIIFDYSRWPNMNSGSYAYARIPSLLMQRQREIKSL